MLDVIIGIREKSNFIKRIRQDPPGPDVFSDDIHMPWFDYVDHSCLPSTAMSDLTNKPEQLPIAYRACRKHSIIFDKRCLCTVTGDVEVCGYKIIREI